MQKLLILYATVTGNTLEAASFLEQALKQRLPELLIELKDISLASPNGLIGQDLIILGSSSWDDGVNSAGRIFLDRLKKEHPNLSGVQVSLFGLGDSMFEVFCPALPVLKSGLAEAGARIDESMFTIDGYPSPEVLKKLADWAEAFVTKATLS